jgi:argininosuccinate lyase
VKVDSEKTRLAASSGYSTATDLADYLVRKGLEFRKAHELVGRVVTYAIEHGKPLEEILLEEYREFSPLFEDDLYKSITIESSLASKSVVGGTSPECVSEALTKARREID